MDIEGLLCDAAHMIGIAAELTNDVINDDQLVRREP